MNLATREPDEPDEVEVELIAAGCRRYDMLTEFIRLLDENIRAVFSGEPVSRNGVRKR